jgi:hypothetical protein
MINKHIIIPVYNLQLINEIKKPVACRQLPDALFLDLQLLDFGRDFRIILNIPFNQLSINILF